MARHLCWRRWAAIGCILFLARGAGAADPTADAKPAVPGKSDIGAHPDPGAKPAADPAAEARDEKEFYELYRSLADTVDQVDRNYVKKVDRRELMEAAIKGILTKLDPYSSYIPPDEAGHFRDTVESQFGGIGIQITVDDAGQLKILSPLAGTPAYKAGILAGDRIMKIGDEATAGLSLDEAVHKLKGDTGTSVTLTIIHPGQHKPETLKIQREVIHVDTVLGDTRNSDGSWNFMLDDKQKIGYIRITTFSRDTAVDLQKALVELKARKMRGLILDLRFDPGGLLTAAVKVCDLFLNEGERIVSTEGRNSPKRVWDATKADPKAQADDEGFKKTEAFTGFPMVVLVNHYSASASEITSACLQDHQRAVVVGERSWGKGSVQNVIELEDGKSLLKLTTAGYLRPNGHNIHRFPDAKETDEWGVSPNPGFEVKFSDADLGEELADRRDRDILLPPKPDDKSGSRTSPRHFTDRQLQKAIDYLTGELAKKK